MEGSADVRTFLMFIALPKGILLVGFPITPETYRSLEIFEISSMTE